MTGTSLLGLRDVLVRLRVDEIVCERLCHALGRRILEVLLNELALGVHHFFHSLIMINFCLEINLSAIISEYQLLIKDILFMRKKVSPDM